MTGQPQEKKRLLQKSGLRPLKRRLSSISISVSNLVKEIEEHSLPNNVIKAKRVGLSCALLCAFLGSVKGWMVSELADLGPAEIFGLRSVGSMCYLVPLIIYRRSRMVFDTRTNLTLALRSLVGNVAVAGYYYGFAYLPLAEASLIFYSTPIYTTLIGWLFLREHCGISQFASLLLCTAGVALVSSPTLIFHSGGTETTEFIQSFQGVVGCLIGALAQAVAMVILRRLDNVSAEVVSFWWALTGAAACFGVKGVAGRLVLWSCGWESGLVVTMTLVGFLTELAMIAALYLEEAGPVSVALTSEILWALALQTGLQGEAPTLITLTGALLILLSMVVPAVWTACRRWRRKKSWPKRRTLRKGYEELADGNESVQVVDTDDRKEGLTCSRVFE